MKKSKTFVFFPSKKVLPVLDLDVSIIHFGYEKANKDHKQGPHVKTEHILQYVLEGEGFLQIGKALYPVKPGDLFYLPKNVLLTYYANPENPYRYYWLGVDGVSAKMLLSKAKLTPQTPVKHYNNDDMVRIFENIEALLERNDFMGYVAANGEMYQLFSLLLSYEEENLQNLKNTTDEYVEKAIEYIKNNFSNDIRITDIARHVGLNRNYFSVLFHQYTNLSPVEYLLKHRIFQAEKMLKQGFSVTETAMNCGFNSPAHFSVQFKKITGTSPSTYKKR